MTSAMSSGVVGYSRAEAMVSTAAANIATYPSTQVRTSQATATSADSADLSSNAVSLIEGRNSAQANLASIHVADEMQKSLIDILG